MKKHALFRTLGHHAAGSLAEAEHSPLLEHNFFPALAYFLHVGDVTSILSLVFHSNMFGWQFYFVCNSRCLEVRHVRPM